jgi:hypothetical protein
MKSINYPTMVQILKIVENKVEVIHNHEVSSTCFEKDKEGRITFEIRLGECAVKFDAEDFEFLLETFKSHIDDEDEEFDEDEDEWLNGGDDERDEYPCPECGEMIDVQQLCNPSGTCNSCCEFD